jgi:hypothetical protein
MGEPMNCQRRFRDGLVLCDPGDTGTFRRELFPSEQLRAIDINVGKPVCLENSNLYMLHFSAMFMQVGTIFFWVIPPMIITFLVVRYLVCTRWCSYEKLTSLFAMEEKAQGFAELS